MNPVRGSNLPQSKLSERLVPVVRELHAAGISTRQFGRGLGVDHTAVWQAIRTYSVLHADGSVEQRFYTWDHVR